MKEPKISESQHTMNKKMNKRSFKKTLAKSILSIIFIVTIVGVASLIWTAGNAIYNSTSTSEKINGVKFVKPDGSANKEKAIELSEELMERLSKNSQDPSKSEYHISWASFTITSNEEFIDGILQHLAAELGSSETLGVLRTIRENKDSLKVANELTKSVDPNVANQSLQDSKKLKKEIQVLTKKLRESYEKDGFHLTEEQVNSLVYSPHGEETASIINCFQNIKAICFVMENRLRKHPSHEMAKKYYGAYHAMLLALDKMQKNAISKINFVHIPETQKVEAEARNASLAATDLLTRSMNTKNLSFNQQEALRFNIESYDKTLLKARKTEAKLRESVKSLEQSNTKLQFSIGAAENSHTAMRLHTEIERIGQDHIEDIEKLQEVTLPEMIAADFSDPDDPWLSPAKLGEPN